MTTKQLGNSDMKITPLGVGAWAMGGGGWAFGWGPQDDNESVAAIRAALDRGIKWIFSNYGDKLCGYPIL